jgi:hypothetical protein
MTLVQQLWGTTNERIHTVGTLCLALSALLTLTLGLEIKANGLVTFGCFGAGINLIGIAMLRNAWTRWRRGEDSLVLLKKRGNDGRVHAVSIHVLGYRIAWEGRVAHVDVGTFELRQLSRGDTPSTDALPSRCYQLFRASYWFVCSTLTFQLLFGLVAVGYSLWLLDFLMTYQGSTLQ